MEGINIFFVNGDAQGNIFINDREYECRKNTFFVLRAYELMRINFLYETSFCVISFDEFTMTSTARRIFNENARFHVAYLSKDASADLTTDISFLKKEISEEKIGSDIIIKTTLSRIILAALPNGVEEPLAEQADSVQEAILFIDKFFYTDISAAKLSKKVGLSQTAFSKRFKKRTGVSFSDYILNLRMQSALSQIQTTSKTILQISFDCGFKSLSYFIKVFKEYFSESPEKYRRMKKKP